MKGKCLAAACCVLLVGCATQEPSIWLRTDGQRIPESAALLERARLDTTICDGEAAKADNAAGGVHALRRIDNADAVVKGCMAQRGYILVPERLAEQRRAELIAAQQRK